MVVSGAAGALTERDQTLLGPLASPALQNAPLVGAQSVLATYAKQILESIQRDGFYVRVPAGKQFYLYVTQTIDRNEATVGGSRVTADDMNEVSAPPSQTFVSSRPPLIPTTQGKKP